VSSPSIRLYSYFRSTTSYRVRIALNLKGCAYETVPIHLLRDGGEQYQDSYSAVNPMSELPTLQVLDESGREIARIGQSVAILEYLEERFPDPALLPKQTVDRALVRQRLEVVNSSIHPVQNLKVMRKLSEDFGTDRLRNFEWAAYWIERGFRGLEVLLEQSAGRYSVGDAVTLADIALVPQVYNAHKFGVELDAFPVIARVDAACRELEAFQLAAPDAQPDFE
jgi:maleylpyruvate isomerase